LDKTDAIVGAREKPTGDLEAILRGEDGFEQLAVLQVVTV
jgi:hypothetical protein